MDENLIVLKIKKQFGIDCDLSFLKFYTGGKNKIYAYYKNKKFPEELKKYKIHSGIYIGKLERDGIRLSIDGSNVVGRFAKRNVITICDELAEKWMAGEEISINLDTHNQKINGKYVILKWRDFYIGCGKIIGNRIINYVPKDRRVKKLHKIENS